MAKWNMFRGRLQTALLLLDAEAEDIKPGLAVVAAETQGAVNASVLEAFLREERADLPPEYLPLLCGMKSLGLGPSDYGERHVPGKKTPEPTERQKIARSTTKTSYNQRVERSYAKSARPQYVFLDCGDPEAIRIALRDRISRAGWTQREVSVRFFNGKLKTSGHCQHIHKFFYEEDKGAPHFSYRFQERFWDICAALNSEIHAREGGGPQPTTEQFVRELFREGTVLYGDEVMKKLKILNEHYHTHIAEDVPPRG